MSEPSAVPPFRRSAAAPPEGQTFAGESLLVRYANFVKLPHTLFALPFALLGVLAASMTSAVTIRTVVARGARLLRRALGRDGVQPHRRPRLRRPQPADDAAGAPPGRDHALPGLGVGAGGRRRSSFWPPAPSTGSASP